MEDLDPAQRAKEAGFDMSLIDLSLSLTPEQRAEEHQKALDLVWEIEKAKLVHDEKPERPSRSAS